MRIGFLWASEDPGFYPTAGFEELFRGVGQNTGNLVYVYAIEKHLRGECIYLPWHTSADIINRDCDIVVFPAANQLGKHTDLGDLAHNLSRVECPIVVLGLGAQAGNFDQDVQLSDGTAAWLDAILENGARHGIVNIYTRGRYTSSQIEKLTGSPTQSGGCPSHFLSTNPALGHSIGANWDRADLPGSIAVAGGHQAWRAVRKIEHQLIGLMMDPLFPGIYVPQSMGEMIKITRGLFDDIDAHALEEIRKHTVPHYSHDEFRRWADRFAKTYYNVPAWADDLRRHDLVIGARYHGTALALQTEKMGCTVAIDSRTEEMCRETGVPFLLAHELEGPITRDTLKNDLIKFDPVAYDEFRKEKCGRYLEFLEGSGLKPAEYLRSIAGA